jgi:predicted GNAT family N-acyltransferase
MPNLRVEPIHADHQVAAFDCGNASLNDWLIHRALKNHEQGYTHVRVTTNDGAVIGYYGLASSTVLTSAAPRSIRGGQPPDPLPALLIGRFAVDKSQQGKGIGQALFRDALIHCLATSRMVAARVILIHAFDAKAAAFYKQFGFVATEAEPLTLYQSIMRIEAAL